jgi:transposase
VKSLFFFTKGAKASAVLYAIVESTKANGLTPYGYLTHLFEQFIHDQPDIWQLLPWTLLSDSL